MANEITTTINIEANIKDMESGIQAIQKKLNGLALPQNVQQSFAQTFGALSAEIDKVKTKTADSKINPIDQKEIEKSMRVIEKTWASLQTKMKSSAVTDAMSKEGAEAYNKMAKAMQVFKNEAAAAKKIQSEQLTKARATKEEYAKQANIAKEAKQVAKNNKTEEDKKLQTLRDQVSQLKEAKDLRLKQAKESGNKNLLKGSGDNVELRSNVKEVQALKQAEEQLAQQEQVAAKAKQEYTVRSREKSAVDAELTKASNELRAAEEQNASVVSGALKNAFDKFITTLKEAGIDTEKLGITFESLDVDTLKQKMEDFAASQREAAQSGKDFGAAEEQVGRGVNDARNEIDKTGQSLTQLTDKQKEVTNLANRVKYFFSLSSGAMLFRRVLRRTVQTITELDKVMTQTAVVTSMTVGDMWKMLPQYTERANQLGVAIKDVYEADTLYYQQGLKTNEVMAVSNETMKMARIAGLETAEATDRMTNALRGFNMEITTTNAQNINDVYSNLAAHTASNVDEISTAMTKVASLAHSANMSFENTAAFLSQIIETTRESAETAGTALKTVIARFSEVKTLYSRGELMGQDEEGQEIDVNKIGGALRTAGIDLNEYITGVKGLDEIFVELSQKWDSLDMVQQRYIATMAAGSRQQSRFIALMQDYNRMTELTTMANNSAGASTEQFGKTLDSLETYVKRLQNAWNEFLLGLLNTDLVKGVIDLLTNLLNTVNKLTNGWDNFSKSFLKAFAAIGAFKIGGALFKGLTNQITNIFIKTGKSASTGLISGLKNGFTKVRSMLNKEFWIKAAPSKETLDAFTKAQTGLSKLSKALDKSGNSQSALNLKQYKTILDELNISSEEVTAMKKADLSVDQMAAIVTDTNTKAKMSEAVASTSLNEAQKAETISTIGETAATEAQNKGLIGNIAYKLGNWAVTKMQDEATSGVIKKILLQIAADKGLTIAEGEATAMGYAMLGVIGLIILAVIALVAILVILISTIAKIAHNNSLEGRLENVNAQIEEFTAANQVARDAVEDLADSSEKYKEIQSNLDGLVTGSKEWNKALFENNQLVLDLIQKYPQLFKYMSSVNGKLTISDEGWEAATKYYQNAAASTSTRLVALNAQRQALTTAQQSKNNYESLKGNDVWDSIWKPLVSGLALGPIGTITGQILNGVATYKDQEQWMAIQKALASEGGVGNLYDDNGEVKKEFDRFAEDIKNNSQMFAAQAAEYEKLKAAQEAYELSLATTAAANAEIANEFRETAIAIATTANEDEDFSKQLAATKKLSDQELKRQYAEAMGYTFDGSKIYNGETEVKLDKDNKENWQKAVANNKQLVNTEEYVKQISDNLKSYYARSGIKTGSREDAIMQRILSGNMSSVRVSDMEYLKQQYGKDNFKDALEAAYKDIGINTDLADIKKLLGEAETTEEEGISEYKGHDVSGLFSELNTVGQNKFKAALDKLSETFGDDKAIQVLTDIENISKTLPEDVRSDFINLAAQVEDWSEDGWISNLVGFLNDADIEPEKIENATSGIKDLANALSVNFLNAVGKTTDQIVELATILDDAISGELKSNNISEEVYKAITARMPKAEKDQMFGKYGDHYVFLGTQNQFESFIAKNRNQASSDRFAATASEESFNTWREGQVQESNLRLQELNKQLEAARADYDKGNDKAYGMAQLTGSQIYDFFSYRGGEKTMSSLLGSGLDFSNMTLDQFKSELKFNYGIEGLQDEVLWSLKTYFAENASDIALQITPLLEQIAQEEDKINGLSSEHTAARQEMIDSLDSNAQTFNLIQLRSMQVAGSGGEIAQEEENQKKINKALDVRLDTYDNLIGLADELNDQEKINALYTEKATDNLVGNLKVWKELTDIIDEAKKDSEVWQQYMKALSAQSGISLDWLTENYDTFKAAMEGDAAAIDLLQQAMMGQNTFEVHLDDSDFINGLLDISDMANLTAEQIEALLQTGLFELQEETVDLNANIPYWTYDSSGNLSTGHLDEPGSATVLTLKKADTSRVQLAANRAGTRSSGKGETHNWLTGLDKYYNLTAAINEQLRKREKMEREYDRLLERREGTYENLKQSLLDQQASLHREIALQQQLQAGRAEQLANAANEKIQWKEGYSTYAAVGAANYARWDEQNHQVVINWDAIHAITDEDLGGAVEAYISKLEEYEKGWEETESTIEDLDDKLYEINERGKDQYLELQERVIDALVKQRQLEIDELKNISDEMNEMNSDIISNIQESIEMERQIRENTKKEEELSDLENRLEYLRRDTSGANQVAILETQEKLEEARQQYTDSLIDQTISQMQDDNEKAQEQREKQIQLMTDQLEWDKSHGNFNAQMYELIKNAWGEDGSISQESGLYKLLTANDTFGYLTTEQQMKWLDDMLRDWKKAMVGEANFRVQQAEKQGFVSAKQNTFGEDLTFDAKTRTWKTASGKTLDSFGWDAENDRYTGTIKKEGPTIRTDGIEGSPKDTGNVVTYEEPETQPQTLYSFWSPTAKKWVKGSSKETTLAMLKGNITQTENEKKEGFYGYSQAQWQKIKNNLTLGVLPNNDSRVLNNINPFADLIKSVTGKMGRSGSNNTYATKYASGGLNTSTGPAWLDGTASKPEYVLNARDTQVYLTLTNLLNKLLSNTSSVSDSASSGGDNYFNIDINVDELGSDYDVDQLMERIKSQIVNDAMYRNVNVINLHR